MRAGHLGLILTPLARNKPLPGVPWIADNGAFGGGIPEETWWAWLQALPLRQLCTFAVAPDVVSDAPATLEFAHRWLPQIRALGIPAAFVLQDGAEHLPIPWPELDALFIGGSTEYKLGPQTRAITAEARRHGKPVHMGRVNTERRLQYAAAIGCSSSDGTLLRYAPDFQVPRLLGWLETLRIQPALWEA